MNAVLRVDDESRLAGLLDPLVDGGRTIARRRPGIDVVLGRFLQSIVAHDEMDRLVLLMIGVREIDRRQPIEGQPAVGLRIVDGPALGRRLKCRKIRPAVLERAELGPYGLALRTRHRSRPIGEDRHDCS